MPRKHRARAVQCSQKWGQSHVLGAAGSVQQMHSQRTGRRIRQQAGAALEEGLEQAAGGLGIVQLRCQRSRHVGLGPVGQHAQRLHQLAQWHRQGLQFLLGRQFARQHVLGGCLTR